MIPVDTDKAKTKTSSSNKNGWEMPEKNLFERLNVRTRGRVILADDGDGGKLAGYCRDQDFISKVQYSTESFGALKINPITKAVSSKPEPVFVELVIEG